MDTTTTPPTAAPDAKRPPAAAAPARNKNWLMASTRKWHIWLGVAIALFLSFLCLSGILLAHKDTFKPMLDQPIGTVAAVDMPEKDFVPLTADEKKILKDLKEREKKEKDYERRVKREAMLAAGETPPKEMERGGGERGRGRNRENEHDHDKEKEHGREKMAGGPGAERGMRGRDDDDDDEKKVSTVWKVMKDLHTGKFLDSNWMYFNDMIAIIGIFLSASGVYLWASSKLKQRENAKKAKAALAAKAAAHPSAAGTPALARATAAPAVTPTTALSGAAGE